VTPLLSIALGMLIAALCGLVLLALATAAGLLLVLALLALDVLLERNGVDRRSGVMRIWSRLRRPVPVRPPGTKAEEAGGAGAGDAPADRAPRVPFSARRPARAARPAPAEPQPVPVEPQATPAETLPEPVVAAPPRWAAAPKPADEAPPEPRQEPVTEVLATDAPPVARTAPRARATRAPRTTTKRTPPAARDGEPAPGPTATDRDSAIDRLFAPLLESDRTEPLPKARPARRPADES
jgi:hypothetical protein